MPASRKTIKTLHPPEGFRYKGDLITPSQETELVERIQGLPLTEYEFHGYLGKRRTISFGLQYARSSDDDAEPIPEFLLPLREMAADFAELTPSDLQYVLVTEYTPGSPIGWHRDRPMFEDVVGVSLLSLCVFRFRRSVKEGWQRHSVILNPRSVYLLRGPSRSEWQHSIPEVKSLRYSITFRSLRAGTTDMVVSDVSRSDLLVADGDRY
jgi:alkylated DNA repair dioxygenase AlkB